jgi:hypothetical protein
MTRPGHPDRKRTPSALAGRGSQCRSQQARSAHPRLAASGLCIHKVQGRANRVALPPANTQFRAGVKALDLSAGGRPWHRYRTNARNHLGTVSGTIWNHSGEFLSS